MLPFESFKLRGNSGYRNSIAGCERGIEIYRFLLLVP